MKKTIALRAMFGEHKDSEGYLGGGGEGSGDIRKFEIIGNIY